MKSVKITIKILLISLTLIFILSLITSKVNSATVEDIIDIPIIGTSVWDGGIKKPTRTIIKDGITYYEICSAEELAYIAQTGGDWLTKNYTLLNNIELNTKRIDYDINTGELITMPNTLKEWTPIGGNADVFEGIFKGNGHTISGLYINCTERTDPQTTETGNGLFGATYGGRIDDVHIINSYVKAIDKVGGIVGFAQNNQLTSIENCSYQGAILGSIWAGGIVGQNAGNVVNCKSLARVYGITSDFYGVTKQLGGIAGSNGDDKGELLEIKNCYYLKDSTIKANININGCGESQDKKGHIEAKNKVYFENYIYKGNGLEYFENSTTIEQNILGDITGDKKIDTKDARQVLLAYVGKAKLTEIQRKAADVNKDGKVDTKDARQILLYYVGKIKNFSN